MENLVSMVLVEPSPHAAGSTGKGTHWPTPFQTEAGSGTSALLLGNQYWHSCSGSGCLSNRRVMDPIEVVLIVKVIKTHCHVAVTFASSAAGAPRSSVDACGTEAGCRMFLVS